MKSYWWGRVVNVDSWTLLVGTRLGGVQEWIWRVTDGEG